MDDFTFDDVARAIATGASRRQALRLLAGSVLFAWLPQHAWAAPARQNDACEPGLTYCPPRSDGQPEGCYDLRSDYFHCGSCDVSCPSASPGPVACIEGECVATGCIEGLTDCTGNLDCVDLSSDPSNCGACGTVCDSGVCEGGSCTQVGCPAGSWDCEGNGICVSLVDDPNHCGTCGTVCASGVCEGGFCTTLGCAPGLVACPYSVNLGPAGCYDLATDRNRCGSCDHYCWRVGSTTQRECIEGTCVETGCLEGLTDCTGNLDCVDLEYDANNCGTCGTVCPSGSCQAGVCVSEDMPCPPGSTYCPEGSGDIKSAPGCWDLSSEPFNCGACGTVCASGVCNEGVCAEDTTCAAGLVYCPARQGVGCCSAGCYDLSADIDHCGSCDNSCVAVSGPTNLICVDGECQPCAEGIACGNICYDLQSDPNHCGVCYVACAAGEFCEAGKCVEACETGRTRCNGACVDVSSAPDNCGACGVVCGAGAVCEAGSCAATTPTTRDAAPSTTAAQDATTGGSERPKKTPRDRTDQGVTAASGATNRDNGSTAGGRTIQAAGSSAPASVLVWPFDAKAGQWTIVHGYRAADEDTTSAATPTAERRDFARLAFEFAVCPAADVDVADGTCDLGAAGSDPTWDREATQGSTIVSPVDGTVAWTDGEAPCLAIGIDIAGQAGYRLALFNVEGNLERGQRVRRGKRIGKVPTRGCERGDRLWMALYQPQQRTNDDPVAEREGVPFTGEWAIAGCEYPDDKRTAEQYRGDLAPCSPEDTTSPSP